MKKNNNRYFQYGMNGLLAICGGIFFYYLIFHFEKFTGILKSLTVLLTPFIAGIAIAYVLNPIMLFIERKVFFKLFSHSKKNLVESKKFRRFIRFVATFLSIALFLLLIYGLVILVVPQIIQNIQNIIDRVPVYLLNLSDYFNKLLKSYPDIENWLDNYWTDLSDWFYTSLIPGLETLISKSSTSLLGSVISVFKSVLNFVIGIIIAIYLMLDKELFLGQCKKVLYALLSERKANNYVNNLRYYNRIFTGFLSGKVIDSLIIGILCAIFMKLFKMPYPALISVIVGVTNVIPYFGPFIGAIPSAFIVLMVNPKMFLWFILFIFILQQFDGNILGPKILGDSTGLSSFWVVFSITVFGGLFGIVGMFLGVPTFAALFATFKTFVNEKLANRQMPVNTEFYINSDYHSPNGENVDNSGKIIRLTKKAVVESDDILYVENVSENEEIQQGSSEDIGQNVSDDNEHKD